MTNAPLAIALASLAALPAYAFQNEPTGFRSVEWGTSLDTVKDDFSCNVSPLRPEDTMCRRKADNLKLGAAELRSVEYIFYKGRFISGFIRAEPGVLNKTAIRAAFAAQFGTGTQPNRFIDRWFWFGDTALLSLNCSAFDQSCSAVMTSVVVNNERKAADAAAAKGAAKDF